MAELIDLMASRRRILMDAPHTVSVSDPAVAFNTNMAAKLKNLTVNIEPVQAGSGDPSPDNVRTISGWTGCNITKCGKNLFDQTIMKDQAPWNIIKVYIPAGMQVIMSSNQPSGLGLLVYFRPGGSTTQPSWTNVYSGHPVLQTVPDLGYVEIVQRRASGEDSFENYRYQIEVGSTATAFEAYNSDILTIDWTNEAGTVYGGALDVGTGTLTVYPYLGAYNNESLIGPWVSSMDVYVQGTTPTLGAQVVDMGGEPVVYQLTPTQVKTLLGNNTIYADTGNTSLTYWKH